jgi:hypothetical protein
MGFFQRGAILTAADAAESDYFGISLAVSGTGNVMAVGARDWEGANTDQGGVHIYDRSGMTWVQRGSVLTASDAAASDGFGAAVALSANGLVLVVGAPYWEGGASGQGAVYTFDWSGSAWVSRGSPKTASDAAAGDEFGSAVALSDDGTVLAVGAPMWENTGTNRGGVYIFDWDAGLSAWVQRGPIVQASDAADNDRFGTSVALSGDGAVLAVGATGWEGTNESQGGVYVYDDSGGVWTQRGAVMYDTAGQVADGFGSSVALSAAGTRLAVGAIDYGAADYGGVLVYDWSGSAWTLLAIVEKTGTKSFASFFFGSAVALTDDGASLMVGASALYDTALFQGGVYTFDWVVVESGTATAAITINVAIIDDAAAPITIDVMRNTGTAAAAVRVLVQSVGNASAPIQIGVVDALNTTVWSFAVAVDGDDVTARCTGRIDVDAEESAARIARFTLVAESGPVNPLSYAGTQVIIDLSRMIVGVPVPARLFTGVVDEVVYNPNDRTLAFTCTDDLQNKVAALSENQIEALCGNDYLPGAHGEHDDQWDKAKAVMAGVCGSLDAGPHGNLRVTPWHGLAIWRTFATTDVIYGNIDIQLPKRTGIVNKINIEYQYRYYRLRQRGAAVGWSKSAFGTEGVASGFQYPNLSDVQSVVNAGSWVPTLITYSDAPSRVPYGDPGQYVETGGGIASFSVSLTQRHSQNVTETYSLTVSAPYSIDKNGELGAELRGALETTWSPQEWETDYSTDPQITVDMDYAPDCDRATSDATIEALLAMARCKILAAHRRASVSFDIPCIPEIDTDRAVEIDHDAVQAAGKIKRVQHSLDIASGSALSRVTIGISGINADGTVTETPLVAPAVPDEVIEPDNYMSGFPHLGNWIGNKAGVTYTEDLHGFFVNGPRNLTVRGPDPDQVTSLPNPFFVDNPLPVSGFKFSSPGVDSASRNSVERTAAAEYVINVPDDSITLTA